ncbi:MAG: phosphatase PAP2 family protein [Clostridia bacterium]|nr:phosphatase PAP2 family protein [Clostridia bacterium]
MKQNAKRTAAIGAALVLAFALWTLLIRTVDVQPVGVNGTDIGLATVNQWFHRLTGVHLWIYTVTDWLGLVPIAICLCFAALGLVQLIRRRNLLKVDADILLLGGYYILVIIGYLIFEMIPINYRPILIDGAMEASYPSSTTLLVLSVMPTLTFQVNRRTAKPSPRRAAAAFALLFSAFMVLGRLVAGVHWLTDIIGAILLSAGLYSLYRASVLWADGLKKEKKQ